MWAQCQLWGWYTEKRGKVLTRPKGSGGGKYAKIKSAESFGKDLEGIGGYIVRSR